MVCGIQPYAGSSSSYGSGNVQGGGFAQSVSNVNCVANGGSVVQLLGQIKDQLSQLSQLVQQLSQKLGAGQGGGTQTCGTHGAGSSQTWGSSSNDVAQAASGIRDQLNSLSQQLDTLVGYQGGGSQSGGSQGGTWQGGCNGGGQTGSGSGSGSSNGGANGAGGSGQGTGSCGTNGGWQAGHHAGRPHHQPKPVVCPPPSQGPQPKPILNPPPVAVCPPPAPQPQPEPCPAPPPPVCDPQPPACDAQWSASEVKDGKGEVTLGSNYTLSFDESGERFSITNNCSGDTTCVWGDPHVDQGSDGANDWDFKKDTTFVLNDGTKITVDTVDANGQQVNAATNGPSYASTLTITNGDKAIVVSGLAGEHDGANNVQVKISGGGAALDAAAADGTTVSEIKGGWAVAGQAVTQAVIDDAEGQNVAA